MILAILAGIYIIMFISALIYLAATMYTKHVREKRMAAREQYQEHIDNMVTELFPPSTADLQYEQDKRKMVADIRTYFNQRKMDAALRDTENKIGLPMNSPMFSNGPKTVRPTPPSIGLWLE